MKRVRQNGSLGFLPKTALAAGARSSRANAYARQVCNVELRANGGDMGRCREQQLLGEAHAFGRMAWSKPVMHQTGRCDIIAGFRSPTADPPKSLDELIAERGVRPLTRFEDVYGAGRELWSDDEFAALLDQVRATRREGD